MRARSWVWALVVVVGLGLGVLIAGVPDPSRDQIEPVVDAAGVTSTTETTAPTAPADEPRPPPEVRVIVFNAAQLDGGAGRLTERVVELGYQTLTPSNAPTQAETVVLFKPGFEAEAAALATGIGPVATTQPLPEPPPYAGTEEADLVVVIGTNYVEPG